MRMERAQEDFKIKLGKSISYLTAALGLWFFYWFAGINCPCGSKHSVAETNWFRDVPEGGVLARLTGEQENGNCHEPTFLDRHAGAGSGPFDRCFIYEESTVTKRLRRGDHLIADRDSIFPHSRPLYDGHARTGLLVSLQEIA